MRKTSHPEDLKTQLPPGLAEKINLLQKLGILDFLSDKYLNSWSDAPDIHLAETIIQITGESPEQREMILHLMNKLGRHNGLAHYHRSMTAE